MNGRDTRAPTRTPWLLVLSALVLVACGDVTGSPDVPVADARGLPKAPAVPSFPRAAPDEPSLPGASLELGAITPATAARCGGTWLRVLGVGFDDETRIVIGGENAPVIERVSASEIHVRSPALPVGTHDAWAIRGGQEAVLEGALTVFDPAGAYDGTWGGPIAGAVNVTVMRVDEVSPLPGAFVVARTADAGWIQGTTDERGQVTLSEPGLEGFVEVTAGAEGFSAFSVVEYDAQNVTVYLEPLDSAEPGGEEPEEPPPAVFRGLVVGLGKYVLPPSDTCEEGPAMWSDECAPCTPLDGCGSGLACVDLGEQGHRCLTVCADPEDCSAGEICGPTPGGGVCMSDPGELVARCAVSAPSALSAGMGAPATGHVASGETFEVSSTRFGEVAVVCLGGFGEGAAFTPTVLGVRRHVPAMPGETVEGLDVSMDHPLDRTLRLRFLAPPTWPDGMREPQAKPITHMFAPGLGDPTWPIGAWRPLVTVSVDLGADGAIPFTGALLDDPDPATWRLPRQLRRLDGNLQDAAITFQTTIPSTEPLGFPRASNLVQGVTHVVEDRVPTWRDGVWTLEPGQHEVDLHDVWAAAADHVIAVGERGRILLHDGEAWTPRWSGTREALRAVDGAAADDVWAVGDAGTVLQWDGSSWQAVEAPVDDYRAVATAPGQPVWVGGASGVHRLDDGGWSLEPAPAEEIHGLDAAGDGRVAAVGAEGRVLVRAVGGSWSAVSSPTEATLLDVDLDSVTGEIVAVGEGGTLLEGTAEAGLTLVAIDGITETLTAVDRAPDGTVFVVGDGGRALRRVEGAWQVTPIPGYRSRAQGVAAAPDGGLVRVVGDVAFVLGPFVPYHLIDEATLDAETGGLTLRWGYGDGPAAQYAIVTVFDLGGPVLWGLLVDGHRDRALLPDLDALAGLQPVTSGNHDLRVVRVRSLDFDIDDFHGAELGTVRRQSWTLDWLGFDVP